MSTCNKKWCPEVLSFKNLIVCTQELLDPNRGFVADDKITLEVHVKADAPHGVRLVIYGLHNSLFMCAQMYMCIMNYRLSCN